MKGRWGAAELLRGLCRVRSRRPSPESVLATLHTELGQAKHLKGSSVAAVLERLDDEVVASGFFEWAAMQEGFFHSMVTWNMLMKAYVNAGKYRQVRSLLRDKASSVFEPDEETYHIVVSGYVKAGKAEQVLGILDEMEARGLATPLRTHSTILLGLCQAGKVAAAVKHLENMEKFGRVTTVSYNIVIAALVKLGLLDEAVGVAMELPGKGCTPDAATYAPIVSGLCKAGRLDEAVGMFVDMSDAGLVPRRQSLQVLVEALVDAERHGDRDRVLSYGRHSGVVGGQDG